jgi:septal ring factor EnvC (AmiA/AmiB activator)
VVRAVYQGRVAYAQWQPHLGLLLMIDHGDGYKSIYGHNGALLRGVGEWVGAGDAIAEVGNTGGQAEPALYFGIVRGVEAEDPDAWLK